MSTVGERILKRRKALGLTQEELAKLMGYKSKSTINKIEMGINDIPQSKIVRFAEVLLTTPSYLMGWDIESEAKENLQLFDDKNPPAEPKLNEGERKLVELFRKVPKDKQELVLQMIEIALKTK
jgi:transcriptional regulator with XRE-family HTH domain